MKTMNRKSFYVGVLVVVLVLFLAACNSSNTASSSENEKGKDEGLPKNYPNKPIDAIVGFAAGGGQDLIMRTTGDILNNEGIMEQPFVVENKPGAGGIVAYKEAAKRKGDANLLTVQPEYGSGWTPGTGVKFSDFKPIASLATSEIFIVVNADSPYKTIDDLIEALKTDPDMTIATLGPIEGGEVFRWNELGKTAGIDNLNYVPKEGSSDGLTAVLAGQVDTAFGVPAVIKDYVKTGKIRALAVLSDERSEFLPDVPTLKESGIDFEYSRFTGIWAVDGVPDTVISYWEENLKKMTETDAWKEFLKKRGLAPYFMGTGEYTELIKEEGSKYEKYLKSLKK